MSYNKKQVLRFKSGLALILAFFFSGCGPKSADNFQRIGFQDRKSEDARAACSENKLLADMGLNGPFLYQLVLCSSNQSENGGESLDNLVNLVKKLGPDQLDTLVQFLLRPHPTASGAEASYPYLTAFNYLLERGSASEDGSPSFALQEERFGPLQDFLKQIRPRQAFDLLVEWNKAGQLNEILAELALLLESLDQGVISGISSELLAGQTLGPGLRNNLVELLRHDPLMFELEAFLRPEASNSLISSNDGNPCFKEWLNRQTASKADENCGLAQQLDESSSAKLGVERWQEGIDQLSGDERNNLVDAGLAFLDHFSAINPAERQEFAVRLLESLEQFWQHNRESSRYLIGLLQMVLNSQASDFEQVAEAAQTLLEPNYSPTLNKLRAKLSESMIQERIEQLLVQSGEVPGCNGLSLPGLGAADLTELTTRMQTYLNPHPLCFDMPPLLAASAAQLGLFLHDSCIGVSSEYPCLPMQGSNRLLDIKLVANDAPDLQREFLIGALQSTIAELSLDRYYLQSRHLAPGPVSPEVIQGILDRVYEQSAWSLNQLVELDQALAQDPGFQDLLHADFIESLLGLHAESLSAKGEQFSNLIPQLPLADFESEYRAARVFAGTYLGGPFEWQIKHELGPLASDRLAQYPALAERFQENPAEFSLFLQRLKDADAIFKNPIYAKQNEEVIRVQIPGSTIVDYLGFNQSGQFSLVENQMLRPSLSFAPSLDLEDENWALWDRFLYRSGLIAKDVPASLGQDFEAWAAQLYVEMFTPNLWQNSDQRLASTRFTDPAIASYFDSQAYSQGEARALVLYLLQHYYKSDRLLPSEASFHGSDRINADLPFKGFMNASYLSSPFEPTKPWSIFVSLFPEVLNYPTDSFDQLAQSLLPENPEGLEIPGGFFDVRGYGFRRNLTDFDPAIFSERLKLFSTLNLLSFTQNRSAAFPQPVVGFSEQICAAERDTTRIACPIEIGNGLPIEDAYLAYRNFVTAQFTEIFCPLSELQELANLLDWTQHLGFSTSELTDKCSAQRNMYPRYTWDESSRFPSWAVAHILEDIFQLGKNPRLRPELEGLASRMRWSKLEHADDRYAELSPAERAQTWLQTASWTMHPQATGKGRYRQKAAAGFWAGQPTMISFYLSLLEKALPTEFYEALLIEGLLAESDPVVALLESFISAQRHHAAQGSSGLAMLLDFQSSLTGPAELTMVHSLLHLNSLQSYDFLARDLPLAVMALFGSRFDWQDPGLHLAKQIILSSHMAGASRLGNRLSSSEIKTGLNLINEQLERFGSVANQERILRIFLEISVDHLASAKLDEDGNLILPSADQLDRLMRSLAHMRMKASFHRHFHQWIGRISEPLSQFNGEAAPSLRKALQQGLDFVMSRATRLVQLHWNAQTSSRQQPYFWSDLGLDLFEPVVANPNAANQLHSMIADPRLGFTGNHALIPATLLDEQSRKELAAVIDVLTQASSEEWLAAARQSGDLLRASQKFLAFADERMKWHDDQSAHELALALKTLRRVGDNDADLWERQLELLDTWFHAFPEEDRLRNYPREEIGYGYGARNR